MHEYRALRVWQAARSLAIDTYRVTRSFPRAELFGLTGQLRRCSVSIAANIAEGSGRATQRDFRRFLRIASGSAAEFETLISIAGAVELLSPGAEQDLSHRIDGIKRMLHGLASSLSEDSGSRSRVHPEPGAPTDDHGGHS